MKRISYEEAARTGALLGPARATRAAAAWVPRPLRYAYDLLHTLVARDITLRYKGSALGLAWSLVNPLAQLLVYYFVFGLLLPLNIPHYASFLLTGVLAWNWFQSSLLLATGAVVDNRELIRRPGFPVGVLPAVTVTSHFIHFLLASPVLWLCLRSDHLGVTTAVFALPVVVAVQFILTLGLAYGVALLHVPFRDTQYLLGIALQLLFFLTPIFYDVAAVPEHYRDLLQLNPMVHLLAAYRAILLEGRLPDFYILSGLALVAVITLAAGVVLFKRARFRFADEL